MRSIEAASLDMDLGAHVLRLYLAGHVLAVLTRIRMLTMQFVPHVLALSVPSHVLAAGPIMQEVCHASHAVGGPSEAAGGPRGPLWKNFVRAAI